MRELMWTEENQEHIWSRHEVVPDEVEQVVNTRPRWSTKGRANIELIYGTTVAGRYLLVVLGEAADGRDYVITAREMNDEERRTFRRKAR